MEKLLKNKNTTLWITFTSIMVLVFKTAPVFHSLSFPVPSANNLLWFIEWLISIISVTVIEIAVLLFISRGNKIESYLFAIVSFFSSVYYFNEFNFVNIKLNIMQVLWSLLYPFIIVRFSHFYNSMSTEENSLLTDIENQKTAYEQDINNLKQLLAITEQKQAETKDQLKQLETENNILKAELVREKQVIDSVETALSSSRKAINSLETDLVKVKAELQQHKDKLTCKTCFEVFDNTQALAGHKKGCKSGLLM